MKRILEILLLAIVIVLCMGAGVLLSIGGEQKEIFKVRELAQCQLTISGVPIDDEAVKEEVLRFCEKTEAYQQRTPPETDPKLGETRNIENRFSFRRWISDTSYLTYSFWFLEAEKQLAIDHIHRDAPLIHVQISTSEERQDKLYGTLTSTKSREVWYCKVPAEDYAEMLNLIRNYVE